MATKYVAATIERLGNKMSKVKQYNIFKFDFVNDFVCDGNYCGSHCCRNWEIEIDRATIAKYRNLKDKKLKKDLDKKINYSAEHKKHRFILNEDGKCPFLDEDYLCGIQKEFGEDYLSNVCATYPRRYVGFADFLTEALSLTCPVVVQMLLMQNKSIVLKEYYESVKREKIITSKLSRCKILMDKFLDIQYAAIKILQEKRFTIKERLINLCLFGEALEELLLRDEQLNRLDSLLQSLLEDEQQVELARLGGALPFNINKFIKDLFVILDKYFIKKSELFVSEFDGKYMDWLADCFHLKEDNKIGDLVVIYDNVNLDYQNYVLNKYKFFQENYLVHQWFRNLQPIMAVGTITQNIIMFLICFRIQELFLMLEVVNNKEQITEKQIVECISYGAQIMENENVFFQVCSEYIKERKYSLIDIMQIWLPK